MVPARLLFWIPFFLIFQATLTAPLSLRSISLFLHGTNNVKASPTTNNNKHESVARNAKAKLGHANNGTNIPADFQPPDLDAMRARAGVLRSSLLKQQLELQALERSIMRCSLGQQASEDPLGKVQTLAVQTMATFKNSANVLTRKLQRVQDKRGPNNEKWEHVGDYVYHQTSTAARIVSVLLQDPKQLKYLVDPETATLVAHVPAIYARLDKLEPHVASILELVLNNRRHLASIEPYLDEVLERFDDIEPHLPWILENVDTLAPYTGLLLKHIDELLLYAKVDEGEAFQGDYDLAEQVLPFLEYYVSRLDMIGPHLPLLRPHVPRLLKRNRIGKISPHIDKLFARGYKDLSASANMDILLFWFGWSLQVPGLPRLFFSLPGSPRLVSLLANRLPKRFVRGDCKGVLCDIGGDYGDSWNRLTK
jgi:hypothetical protein